MNPNKKRLQIDLETTAINPLAAVWQIGYSELGGSFKGMIYLNPYHQQGRIVNQDTVDWLWKNAPDWKSAQDIFPILPPTSTALHTLCESFREQDFDEVWCKGSDFDFAIFRSLLDAYDIKLPWHYSKQCCLRTYLNSFPQFKVKHDKMGHSAMHDADAQNECLGRILKHLDIY